MLCVRSSSCAAKGLLRALLLQISVGFLDRALRLFDLRLRLLEQLLKVSGVHASDHLPGANHVADVGAAVPRSGPGISCRYRSHRPPVGRCHSLCRPEAALESASTNRSRRLPRPKEWQQARLRTVIAARSGYAQEVLSPASCFCLQPDAGSHVSARHHRLPEHLPAVSRRYLQLAVARYSPLTHAVSDLTLALARRASIERYQTAPASQTDGDQIFPMKSPHTTLIRINTGFAAID